MADARWDATPSHLAHAALEASTDGIAILDGRGTLIYVNRAHAELFGYEAPSQLIGSEWRALYRGQEQGRVEREILPALRETAAVAGRGRRYAQGWQHVPGGSLSHSPGRRRRDLHRSRHQRSETG